MLEIVGSNIFLKSVCRNFQDMKARSDELENNLNIHQGPGSEYIGAYSVQFIPSEIDDLMKSMGNMIGRISGKMQLLITGTGPFWSY